MFSDDCYHFHITGFWFDIDFWDTWIEGGGGKLIDNFFFQPGPEVVPKLHDLPEECIREILLRIADHRDLDVGILCSF